MGMLQVTRNILHGTGQETRQTYLNYHIMLSLYLFEGQKTQKSNKIVVTKQISWVEDSDLIFCTCNLSLDALVVCRDELVYYDISLIADSE